MFQIGQGKELSENEFRSITRICIFMVFFGLLTATANAEQIFSNTIRVTTFYINNTYTLYLNGTDMNFSTISVSTNITTEQDTHTYNCLSNSTNTFTFGLIRNVTFEDTNLSKTVSNLASTCDSIAKAYGDSNRYFELYATCNKDFELCKIDKNNCNTKVTELSPFKPNYEKCSTDLSTAQISLNKYSNEIIPVYQGNVSSCNASLDKAEKGKMLYGFFGFLIASGIFVFIERKKVKTTYREKIVGLGRH